MEKSEPEVSTPAPAFSFRKRMRWFGHKLAATALVTEVLPGVAAKARGYAQLTRLDRPIGIWLLLWPVLWALWLSSEGRPDPHVAHGVALRSTELLVDAVTAEDHPDRRRHPIEQRGRRR